VTFLALSDDPPLLLSGCCVGNGSTQHRNTVTVDLDDKCSTIHGMANSSNRCQWYEPVESLQLQLISAKNVSSLNKNVYVLFLWPWSWVLLLPLALLYHLCSAVTALGIELIIILT
jgi:hypothetical protein